MEKVRILHLIASDFIGGPEKQLLHHALDLRDTEIEIWISSFRDRAARSEILVRAMAEGLSTYEIPSHGILVLPAAIRLASFLRANRFSLLCTHGYKANIVGAFAKRIAGCPLMSFVRGWTAETYRVGMYEKVDRMFLDSADRVICVSEAQAVALRDRSRLAGKVTVIPNANLASNAKASLLSRAEAKRRLGLGQDAVLVGAIGRLSVEKGHRFLLDAASHLAKTIPNLQLVILGEGRERDFLMRRVIDLGLSEVVTLTGFRKDVPIWMRAMDVVVLPSLTEGLPNVLLEAMSVSTPVVATRVGGTPELVRHGETGILVPPGDSVALADAIKLVLRDPVLASQLCENAERWVIRNFSIESQREGFLSAYRSILQSRCVQSNSAASVSPKLKVVSTTDEVRPNGAGVGSWPFISIVIPVRNEEKHLGSVLEELLTQEYPTDSYEIVVVDGMSTDGTVGTAEQISRASSAPIRILSNPRRLSSAGRNVGMRNSRGGLVVFVDGHCRIPSATWLRDTARLFGMTGAACLCRPQPLTMPGNSWFQDIVAHVRASTLGHGLGSAIYGEHYEGVADPTSSGACYRRWVFSSIGEFDERFDACEDVEFNYRVFRAGLISYISPLLTVQYRPRNSIGALWRQMARYGRGRRSWVEKHPEARTISVLIPAALLLWLVFGVAASLMSWKMAEIFFGSLVVYAGAILLSSTRLALRHGWRHLLTGPAVYLTIHFGLGWGYLAQSVACQFREFGKIDAEKIDNARNPAASVQLYSGQAPPEAKAQSGVLSSEVANLAGAPADSLEKFRR